MKMARQLRSQILASFTVLIGVSTVFSEVAAELKCLCNPRQANSECPHTGRANCSTLVSLSGREPRYRCYYRIRRPLFGKRDLQLSWGCLDLNQDLIGPCLDSPGHKLVNCCTTDYCNKLSPEDFPEAASWTLPPETTTSANLRNDDDNSNLQLAGGIAAGSVVIFILLILGTVLFWRRSHGKLFHIPRRRDVERADFDSEDVSWVDGSSSGRAIHQVLDKRTISREVELNHRIGMGRFGEVHIAEWRGRRVAVKIFRTVDEVSFFREVELYNTLMLRHENILGFVAADNKDTKVSTELWMVLDYHTNGSLYDHLLRHSESSSSSLSVSAVHLLVSTMVAGVAHLHMHIGGQTGGQPLGHKPSIAHRDLKSKNILVKDNLTCCIADLGMAIRHDPQKDEIQHLDVNNIKVGTRRYMAPEVLDDSINVGLFESFRCVDMYALAMVLWEIAWCCQVDGHAHPYMQPFFNMVPQDPSIDNMYDVVCVAGCRPPIPNRWEADEVLQGLRDIIKTCWKRNPNSRLTATRVKKRLDRLETSIKRQA